MMQWPLTTNRPIARRNASASCRVQRCAHFPLSAFRFPEVVCWSQSKLDGASWLFPLSAFRFPLKSALRRNSGLGWKLRRACVTSLSGGCRREVSSVALSVGGSEMEVSMVDPESRKHVDGGRRSLSGCHFPARHAAVKLEFEGHFPGGTFRLDMRQSSWNSRVIFRAPLSGARVTTKIGKCSMKWLTFRHATFRPKSYKRGAAGKRFQLAFRRPFSARNTVLAMNADARVRRTRRARSRRFRRETIVKKRTFLVELQL